MKIKDLNKILESIKLEESSNNILYHSFKSLDNMSDALSKNKIEGRTTQRYWKDGSRLKDNDPRYKETSFWMKGISTTRDLRFAEIWGAGYFILDKNAIKQTHKIIPFNWGYSIPSQKTHKREFEEFILTGKTELQDKDFFDPYNTDDTEIDPDDSVKPLWLDWIKEGHGKPLAPLSKYLIGFKLNDWYVERFSRNPDSSNAKKIQELMGHPKYLGLYKDKIGNNTVIL